MKNSRFHVLHAQNAAEYKEWMSIWQQWAGREVMAHPDYAGLFARREDSACCAVMDEPGGMMVLPFIVRPLAVEEWAADLGAEADLTSPYGYGGPYIQGTVNQGEFWSRLTQWANDNSVLCWFIRLALSGSDMALIPGETRLISRNIVCGLSRPLDEIWRQYEHKVRKNVTRARSHQLEVRIDFDGTHLDEFMHVYNQTMDRRQAAEIYYFNREFFQRVIDTLGGSYAFFHVLHEQRLISTELVLVSAEHVYSFLGGTLADYFELRPNELLKHAVIEWGMSQGKKSYILGGGYGGDDGIFKYKKAFAPDGEIDFLVNRHILNEAMYQACIQRRIDWSKEHQTQWEPQDGYFPKYRG